MCLAVIRLRSPNNVFDTGLHVSLNQYMKSHLMVMITVLVKWLIIWPFVWNVISSTRWNQDQGRTRAECLTYLYKRSFLTKFLWTIWRQFLYTSISILLQWCHSKRDCVSNQRRLDCLLNRLFRRTSKLRVIGLCEGNPPVTGGFPSQSVSNAKNVSVWWRHHAIMDDRQDVFQAL